MADTRDQSTTRSRRARRLAGELKANLARRKAQARERAAEPRQAAAPRDKPD